MVQLVIEGNKVFKDQLEYRENKVYKENEGMMDLKESKEFKVQLVHKEKGVKKENKVFEVNGDMMALKV
jgi:hypothetical protein